MSTMNLPLEIYDLLERRVGRDDAMAVAKSIEVSLSHIADRSKEMAAQRKLEAKNELRVELRDELSTKEDLAKLEGQMHQLHAMTKADLAKLEGQIESRFERMDKKFTLMFAVTIFTVVFLNQNALEFLAKIFGLIK